MPEEARDGSETLSYSHRLNTGYAPPPRNYRKDFKTNTKPVLVIVGTVDEAFIADQFPSLMSNYEDVEVELLPEVTHMGLVVGSEV